MGVDQTESAITGVTIVRDFGFPINSDTAAGSVEQPVTERKTDAAANRRVKIALAVTERVVASEETIRLMRTTIDVHVSEISFNTEHEPVPLIIVTDLTARDHARRIVAPWFFGEVVIVEILVFAMTKIAPGVYADIKTDPIAFRQWRRRNLFHFFPTVRFRAGESSCRQRTARGEYTH